MRKFVAVGALGALMAGPVLAADNFSYNQIELGLIGTSVDDEAGDLDTEGGGLSLAASVEFTPNVFGFINLSSVRHEFKYYDEDFDIGRAGIGVGFNLPLTQRLDLVSGISLEGLRLDDGIDEIDGSGYGLNLGLRGGGGRSRFEWNVGLKYVDLKFDDENGDFSLDDTFLTGGFRYSFTRTFALGLDLSSNGDDESSALVAFRWTFADRN